LIEAVSETAPLLPHPAMKPASPASVTTDANLRISL
jgi:hypothetical protein